MKKFLSIALVGVFALSFAAGVFVSKSQAGTVILCYKAGECDYITSTVWTCCFYPKGNNGQTVEKCSWDSTYFNQWCTQQ